MGLARSLRSGGYVFDFPILCASLLPEPPV